MIHHVISGKKKKKNNFLQIVHYALVVGSSSFKCKKVFSVVYIVITGAAAHHLHAVVTRRSPMRQFGRARAPTSFSRLRALSRRRYFAFRGNTSNYMAPRTLFLDREEEAALTRVATCNARRRALVSLIRFVRSRESFAVPHRLFSSRARPRVIVSPTRSLFLTSRVNGRRMKTAETSSPRCGRPALFG